MVPIAVYGFPETHLKHRTWSLLRHLNSGSDKPWLLMGDFNELLFHHDKKGGQMRLERQLLPFREFVEDCGLRDLGYSGQKYTWCNGRSNQNRVWERLDRFLANSAWMNAFTTATVTNGVNSYSDHSPIWVDLDRSKDYQRFVKPFRFEAMWVDDATCENLIKDVWANNSNLSTPADISSLIKDCGQVLERWNKHTFGNVQKQLSRAQTNLKILHERDPLLVNNDELSQAREQVQVWLERNEVMWRQRSKALWLKTGDSNTKCFHMKATQRKKKKNIVKILDDDDCWNEGYDRDRVITQYFQSLFTTSHPSASLDFVAPIANRVTDQMNMGLTSEYRADEVKIALLEMDPNKAPGPDGMSPIFFQKYWHVVGPSVTEAVLQALNSDDSIIFCKADLEENRRIQLMLSKYEAVSGQKINKEKTAMIFSTNVSEERRTVIKNMWSNCEIQQYEKYLGLPPIIGRSKKRAFQSIKQRVWQKLQSWKERLLSQGGKEVLLKAVALSIPTYTMSCFLLPTTFCHELESMMSNFWWEQKGRERKIHWISWSKMCHHKAVGGIGFKDLRCFNLALLAKQGWRLSQENSSLLHQLFKAKYFPNCSFLKAGLGHSPSYTWRGIWEARRWIQIGSKWRIGDGKSVNIWHDQWIPGHRALLSEGNGVWENSRNDTVDSLFVQNGKTWDPNKLRTFFNPNIASDIEKIYLGPDEAEDRMFWSLERSGCFSVRSCYRMIFNYIGQQQAGSSNGSTEKLLWKHLWKMKVPHKVKVFAWRACKDGLPTALNLEKKHITRQCTCSLCNSEIEDLNHAVINCNMLRRVWNNFFPELVNNNCRSIKENAIAFCEKKEVSKLDTFFMLLWCFWFRRNKYVHDQIWLDPRKTADNALGLLDSFNKARKTNCVQIRKHFKWTPPDLNFLKLNVDGATFKELEKAGIGAVLRDFSGKVIMAMSKIEISVNESKVIELLAIFRGMQLCVNLGIQNLMVESDSKLVIEALQTESMLNSSLGVLYHEVKHLATQFVNCKFSHIYRESNMVAHKLARHAKVVDDICVWLDSIPDCVSQAIWLDNCL